MERFRKRFWAPALEAAGLDGEWVPHELRHTAVTLWRMADVRIEVAAKWLGHRDTRLVTDLYSHVADLEGVEECPLKPIPNDQPRALSL